ncbi:MAG: hypothetical protein QXW10_00525 [Candidatus Micrarchaeaceae archaeon]
MQQTVAGADLHRVKGAEFFLRSGTTGAYGINDGSKAYAGPSFSYVKSSEAVKYFERFALDWQMRINGTYENFVSKWLLDKNIPAVYELRFVLEDKYIHCPDFITGMVSDNGKLVLINPHTDINQKFMNEQQLLRDLGFYIIIVSKKSTYYLEKVDSIDVLKFTDEYWHIEPSGAETVIKNRLDSIYERLQRISKDEMMDRLSKMEGVNFMIGATYKLVYPAHP